MRRRAFGLVAVSTLALAVFTMSTASLLQLEAARHRTSDRRYALQAESMALSGLDFAAAMLRHGRWQSSREFHSPPMEGGGEFVVRVQRHGAGWKIHSTGRAGWRECRREQELP